MRAEHRFLRFILPESWFAALRAETRQWLLECPCGHKQDLWAAGGVRYKAAGQPRRYLPCAQCGRRTWHTVRKKSGSEQEQI